MNQSETIGPPAVMPSRVFDVTAIVVLLLCAALLLFRLGHYALWDDEAGTAIVAHNVWKFGDTYAWDGTNIAAYRNGLELVGIKNRVFPPAQFFFAAPFLGLLGRTAFAARLPFALAAIGGFTLWWWWLRRERASIQFCLLTAIAILGNVSLFLYSRQARYYALAWALSLALAYLYMHRDESRGKRILFAFSGVVLLATNYFSYGATMICLFVDYLLFENWKKRDAWSQVFIFLIVQALGFCVIVGIWYPFGRQMFPSYVPTSWITDKLIFFWWNLRDLNACEFMWTPILVVALLVWFFGRFRDVWLIRSILAIAVYSAVISILAPFPIELMNVSYAMRYMVAIIPLGIFVSVRVLMTLPFSFIPTTSTFGVLLFLTSIPYVLFQKAVHAPTAIPIRSTLVTWLGELVSPQDQAYRAASAWLNANAKPLETVYALPEAAIYPLMFHAPQQVYAWQFGPEKRSEYSMLPMANFKDASVPEIVVVFGGYEVYDVNTVNRIMADRGIQYKLVAALDVFGRDQTRPELIWHSFVTIPVADPKSDGTYVFRRVP
jgi:hypothetical protein